MCTASVGQLREYCHLGNVRAFSAGHSSHLILYLIISEIIHWFRFIILNLLLFCTVVNKIVFLILFLKSIASPQKCRWFSCVPCLQMKHCCIWAQGKFFVILMFFCGLFRIFFSHKIMLYASSSLIEIISHSFIDLHTSWKDAEFCQVLCSGLNGTVSEGAVVVPLREKCPWLLRWF